MLCARDENERQCMACVTSQGSVYMIDTCILHCIEKKKMSEAFATAISPQFSIFPLRLSSTVNSSLFCLRVFLIQWSRRSPADSTVWNGKQHVVRQSPSLLWRLRQPAGKAFIYFSTPTPRHATRALCLVLDEYFIINVKAAVRWPQHCTQWPASSLLSAHASASHN